MNSTMSINMNTGGDQTCLFCYCVIYNFRQTENDVPLPQIITTCNKHLPQGVIDNINWENVISTTNFCQDCRNIAIQLVTLNADVARISKEIEVLSSHFSNRIVSGKRNYELSIASTTTFHNYSPEDSNGDNISDLSIITSPNASENYGNSGSLEVQASQRIYNMDIDFHNNTKSNYGDFGDTPSESARENKNVNESSVKNTNMNKRTAKQKHPQKIKNADSTKGSTDKTITTPPTIVTGSDLQHHIDNDIASGFQCEKCHKRFSRLTILQKHDCSKPTFECEVCNKSFSGTGVLKLHMRCHTGEKPFKCDTCGKSFAVRCHLTTHLRVHSEEKPFKCDICDKAFREDIGLKKHINTHKKGESKYKCDICSKSLGTFNSLKNHLLYHKGEMPHKCVTCGKAFPSKTRLRIHERSHLEEKSFKCELCGKGFADNYRLKVHVETHSAVRKTFLCEECGKSFRSSDYLAMHILSHTENCPFVCETCGKKFVTPFILKRHIDSCHNEETVKCEKCNSVCKSQKDLLIHQESIDCDIGPTFMCNQCDKSFNNKTSRQRHIAIEHLNENEQPKFKCEFCAKPFYLKRHLNSHKRRSTGCHLLSISNLNQGVSCKACKNYFDDEAKFQLHKQNRSKTQPIKCNFCPDSLRNMCEYNVHRQMLHPNGESSHKCKICNIPFGSRTLLRVHRRRRRCQLLSISNLNEGSVSCKACKNYFEDEAKFQIHKQNRSKVLQIRCNFCPDLLRSMCEYNVHRRVLHPNVESSHKSKIGNIPCGSRKNLRGRMKEGHYNYNESSDEEDSDIEDSIPSSSSMTTRSSKRRKKMETESESSSEEEDEEDNAFENEGNWNPKHQIVDSDSEAEKIEIKVKEEASEIKTEDDDFIYGI